MQYVNTTMGVVCCAVCVILLICVTTSEYHKEKLNKIFVSVLAVTILLIMVDISIFVLEGRAGAGINFIFRTAYFLSFILGAVLLILFTFYFLALINIKAAEQKRATFASYGAIVLCAVNILLIILTQFFGLYYRIGENNSFQHGDYYLVSQILAIACMLLNTGVIFVHRKIFEKRELVFLLSYITLPLLSIFVHNMIEDTIASIDVATTLTILIFYAGVQSELSQKLKEKELELAQSRINIMLSQIQPHFLYNALTSINNLCQGNPEARKAITTFSDYLRGNMDTLNDNNLISIETELEHTRQYLWLEELRFEERLSVVYEIDAEGFLLPALTIQPLVENAVRYGITKKEEGGTVTIRTERTAQSIRITITDDGVGFDTSVPPANDGRSHMGITSVRARLAAMCGGSLSVKSVPGEGTTAVIELPIERVIV